ncbi:MAG TPA: lysylphosphatidylglycerol synthase transmembrane domain-containing protein [Syntrophales bacterium]|nr:lysylphosphatidylglycerol synthase transmembrane domain-containing protein [Syntrophales bacterium]
MPKEDWMDMGSDKSEYCSREHGCGDILASGRDCKGLNGNGGKDGICTFTWRKVVSFCFRLAVSVGLLLWIFKSIDFGIFSHVIASPRVLPIVGMISFSLLYVFLGGLKLWFLFRDFSSIGRSLFIGYFVLAGSVGSLAPAIFGDFTLIGLARRSEIPIHKSLSAIFVDRAITLVIALFIFTPFTIAFVLPEKSSYIFPLTVFSVALFSLLLWLAARFGGTLFGKFQATKRFWDALAVFFAGDRRNLYANIIISALRGIVSGITLILALMAANVHPPLIPSICISNSLSVITHIPVSISGLGVFEGSGLFLFEALGMNREEVLAGLLYHRMYIIAWALLTSLILTLIFMAKRRSRV